ncbi:MAG: signal peptidase I [Bacilli bacterium]|nr:signal peptidase I [Bacilli bacterium]
MVQKIIKYVISILTVCFFLIALFILVLGTQAYRNNEPFKIFGYTYSVVPTGSMEPEIMPGEFVLAKDVEFSSIIVGDDVIYHSEMGIYIIHRVIEISPSGELTVQGINNPSPDEEVVTISNYVGKVIKHGSILNLGEIVLNKRFALFAIVIVIFAILLVTELVKIYKTLKEKNKLKLEEEYNLKLKSDIQKERERIKEEITKELDNK